jgi:hypothetical protein
VETHAALREAYVHLLESGVTGERATNHENQRSIYFRDQDDNGLEIYYEIPNALEILPNGRRDIDESLPVGGPNDPVLAWLEEERPGSELPARIDAFRPAGERQTAVT